MKTIDIPSVKFNYSTFDSEDIEIIELNELFHRRSKMDHDPNKPHRVYFYLMLYIEQGEGSHFIDFNHCPFTKGSFIFINKNQIQAFALNSNIKGQAILFTEAYIEQIQTNMNVSAFSPAHLHTSYSPVFRPSSSLTKSCISLLSEIRKEMIQKDKNNLIIMFLFSSMFTMLERERPQTYATKLSKSQAKQFSYFIALLDTKFTEERNASYYSNASHITYKALNNLCRLATNQTAKQLIDAHIIIEAKRRLTLEKKHVQEIALDLGFEEVSNFVKYFKKHTLLTPSQFKKQSES
jgi:AraC-like DNA-binding protein